MRTSSRLLRGLLLFSLLSSYNVSAQDGGIDGPASSPESAGYSCDPTQCQLPSCHCASTTPPGGLSPSDVPQFIVFSADDAIQSYTLGAVNQFLAHRKNPNNCAPKMTYFTSLNYTNFTLVTDWFVAGNEIADHTMTHVGSPSIEEINGNIIALNALAGIPLTAIKGFRAPFLNYTADTFRLLGNSAFTYDSSTAASIPVTAPNTDAYWPYTLDNGLANNCLRVPGTCKGEPKVPGLWEIPMYALFDERGGPHLMDPWLDPVTGATVPNDTATLRYMQSTFTAHYTGNRQPFGIYMHPIHLALDYPGIQTPRSTLDMINAFLDWAQQQQNVWIVSNEQLLDWVQHPVPVSQLDSVTSLHCSTPQVDAKICNGMPANEDGLLSHCTFDDFPFYTCYGCPQEHPTPQNPNPEQKVPDGESARFRLPRNCSTPFWDPIGGKCVCEASQCQFLDTARPIGPNGANLTGGGIGGNFTSPTAFVPFNGGEGAPSLFGGPSGGTAFLLTLVVACIGAVVGGWGVVGRI